MGNTIAKYDQRAENYETKWEHYLQHTHKRFIQHLRTKPGDRILDISGGTGLLGEELVSGNFSFGELVINDPSHGMLEIAQERLDDEPRINFTSYEADKLSFEDSSFDCILCLNAFHFYPNQQRVIDHFCRILKPEGRLFLLDWNRSGFFRIVNQLIKWLADDHITTRSLAKLNLMLEQGSFTIRHTETWRWRYWKFLFIKAQK